MLLSPATKLTAVLCSASALTGPRRQALAFAFQKSSNNDALLYRRPAAAHYLLSRSQQHTCTHRNMSTSASTSASTDTTSSSPQEQVPYRVALLQFPVSHSKETNIQTATDYINEAASKGAKLIVLPEIWNGPYATAAFPEYAEILPSIGDDLSAMDDIDKSEQQKQCPSFDLLRRKAMEHNMYIVGGSIAENEDDKIYNTCMCIGPNGELLAKHRKVHLFDIDVPGGIRFKESDTLTGGSTVSVFDAGEPFGKIGVGICYDIRFPELAMCMIQRGCRMLIYPGAFNLTTGPAHWELLQRGRAVDGQCFVLTASPARVEAPASASAEDDKGGNSDSSSKYPHYTAWGHSTVVSPWGEVLAKCDEKPGIVVCDLEMGKVEEMRQGIPTSNQKRGDLYSFEDRTA